MSDGNRVDIIGVGDDGIRGVSALAKNLIESADAILGHATLLESLAVAPAKRVTIGSDLDELVAAIAKRCDLRLVVLTVGDPLFYGVARFLCDRLGKDRFNVVPHVSSMQLAFARVKESWEEAYLANLDTVAIPRALDRIRHCEKAGMFTSQTHSPPEIARQMLKRGLDYFTLYVCENLGSPNERVTRGNPAEIANLQFEPLNVVILVRNANRPDRPDAEILHRPFGYPDECFHQSLPKRGLLTPVDIRVLALAALELKPNDVLWDVGAGSGSLAIEAALIARQGSVYAIEMDVEDHRLIKTNCRRFGVEHVIPVLGSAPDVWSELPDPDAVFIGGTGRQVAGIALAAWQRLLSGGRLVSHVHSVNNLVDLTRACADRKISANVRMIQIAEAINQLDDICLENRHPTFLVVAKK